MRSLGLHCPVGAALLHSQVQQGIGRASTPDSAASESLSPKSHKLRKDLYRSWGLSSSLMGSPCALGSLQLLMEATSFSSYLSSPRVGSVPPRAPVGVSKTGREKSSPWDAHSYLCLQSLEEMSEIPSPGISLCFRENSNISEDLLFLSPWTIMINIPKAESIYLDHPYTLCFLL